MSDFDYDKAESDLYDSGCPYSEEIFECRTDKGRDEFMRENGLDPSKYYKDNGSSGNGGNNSSSGCFISTACVIVKGLPDDCDELETLRRFRDSYMQTSIEMQQMAKMYYDIAPTIVTEINKLPDKNNIWDSIYNELVAPCVAYINQGENEKAYNLYKSFVEGLATKYMPKKGLEHD